jgi:hypothetical protein
MSSPIDVQGCERSQSLSARRSLRPRGFTHAKGARVASLPLSATISARAGSADGLGATPVGGSRTAEESARHTTATVRGRGIARTLSDGHDVVNVCRDDLTRMIRVEHAPTSISGWASAFARYR